MISVVAPVDCYSSAIRLYPPSPTTPLFQTVPYSTTPPAPPAVEILSTIVTANLSDLLSTDRHRRDVLSPIVQGSNSGGQWRRRSRILLRVLFMIDRTLGVTSILGTNQTRCRSLDCEWERNLTNCCDVQGNDREPLVSSLDLISSQHERRSRHHHNAGRTSALVFCSMASGIAGDRDCRTDLKHLSDFDSRVSEFSRQSVGSKNTSISSRRKNDAKTKQT